MTKSKRDAVSVREALRDTLDAFFKKYPDDTLQASVYEFLDELVDSWRASNKGSESKQEPLPQYLTPSQAAKRLNVSKDAVLGWIKSGELRSIDVALVLGKRPCYRVSEPDIRKFEAKIKRSQARRRSGKKMASKNA
jgi:excisionase family DNA binding protein